MKYKRPANFLLVASIVAALAVTMPSHFTAAAASSLPSASNKATMMDGSTPTLGTVTTTADAVTPSSVKNMIPAGAHAPDVNGNLVEIDGTRFVTKGATLYIGTYYNDYASRQFDAQYVARDKIFAHMKKLGLNAVRIPVSSSEAVYNHVGGYDAYLQRIKNLATSANDAGLLVSFCNWQSMFDRGNWPGRYAAALKVFDDVYRTLGPVPKVIYEPFNEPNGVSTADWYDTMQKVIRHFRTGLGYKGVLQINTPGWSWQVPLTEIRGLIALDDALIGDSNIVIANHRYGDDNTSFDEAEKRRVDSLLLANVGKIPLVGTEYGFFNGNHRKNNIEWNKGFFSYLAKTLVPAGFNGMYAFSWYWADANRLTEPDYTTLAAGGIVYRDYYLNQLKDDTTAIVSQSGTPETTQP